MRKLRVTAFGEDFAHQCVVGSLVKRICREAGFDAQLEWRSSRGGHPRVLTELGQFLDDLAAQHEKPDLLVIATDANCKGLAKRSREILDGSPTPSIRTVIAIPDPHIERWLLLDGAAFKAVFGRGCQAPDQKCERDRYKNLLSNAIYEAGIDAALGGVENADAIVSNLNLERTAAADVSFGRFVHDLRQALQAIP